MFDKDLAQYAGGGDGFNGSISSDRTIKGTQLVWNDAQHWRDRDGQKPPGQLLVVGVDAILQRWQEGLPQVDASPWLAMSVLQKAIRRGREDLTLRAAATLLRDAPDKLRRRVGCIACEDIGVASLEAVGLATVALAGKRHRATLSGEWAVASCLVAEMCRAPKCRAADDLLMACELHPAYAQARAELPHLTTRDLITVGTG